jgi:uncharacterized RDD family membrane protein YckC
MMGEKAGWYRDPAPANPGQPTTLRWWDGQSWTAQVKAAPKQLRQQWQAEAAAQRAAWAAEQAQHPRATATMTAPGAAVAWQGTRDLTPDGQRLAGWGRRVAAYLVDQVILSVLCLVVGWHFLHQVMTVTSTWAQQQQEVATSVGTASAQPDPATMHAIVTSMLDYVAVGIAVQVVYGIGFLKAFSATPGKMMLGMEVRRRDAPGTLSWGTVLVRWLVQSLIGVLFGIGSLLDALWPLWDGKRQALHDKAAGTNVVLTR